MSDWEDFCDSKGWSISSEEDYDKFLDSLEDRPARRSVANRQAENLYFSSFQEAKQWAMANVGQAFTRSPDGSGFIPKAKEPYRR